MTDLGGTTATSTLERARGGARGTARGDVYARTRGARSGGPSGGMSGGLAGEGSGERSGNTVDDRRGGLTVFRALGYVVVVASGARDADVGAQLNWVIGDVVENQGNLRVIVDLEDVEVVDEGLVSGLVAAADLLAARSGELVVGSRHRGVLATLAAAGLVVGAVTAVDACRRCTRVDVDAVGSGPRRS